MNRINKGKTWSVEDLLAMIDLPQGSISLTAKALERTVASAYSVRSILIRALDQQSKEQTRDFLKGISKNVGEIFAVNVLEVWRLRSEFSKEVFNDLKSTEVISAAPEVDMFKGLQEAIDNLETTVVLVVESLVESEVQKKLKEKEEGYKKQIAELSVVVEAAKKSNVIDTLRSKFGR